MNIPRILLTAGASGSGKTLITCGILEALKEEGKKIASFKCGPDYIDPMFHSRVIGTKSRNLDTFFTSPEVTRYLFEENARDCEIAVIEGVMGYYDGLGGTTSRASAYDVAKTTKTPAVLIVNSRGMSVSLAAYIKGFLEYEKDSQIKGVIFNQMSPMLYERMKKLVEERLPVKVYGYVPKVEDCLIESRHLGLVLPHEVEGLKERLGKLAGILRETLDFPGLLKLAAGAEELKGETLPEEYGFSLEAPVRLGLASDEAFCFFYEDNFRLLRRMGAQLVPFSPLHDKELPPDLDGLLLYGGYPELYGKELEENETMKEEINRSIRRGMPCLAECGGFMYLHREMEDMQGNLCRMTGIIPGKAVRTPRLTRFGYIMLEQNQPVLGTRIKAIPAHEFHYFDSDCCGDSFHAQKPESKRGWDCIVGNETMAAGFPHIYYYGNPEFPKAFLKACEKYQRERRRK